MTSHVLTSPLMDALVRNDYHLIRSNIYVNFHSYINWFACVSLKQAQKAHCLYLNVKM